MYVIALIGIGLVLHGFIMLTFAAFRARPSWGLAVLFVPFAQLFFPIYHWDEARKPFMTFTFGMALWLGTAVVFGQGPMDEFWLDQINMVQSAEHSGKRPARPESLEERAKKLDNRAVKMPAEPVAPKTKKGVTIRLIDSQSLNHYVGHEARVTLRTAKVRNGRITGTANDTVTLQYTIGEKSIGNMTYAIAFEDIEKVEIVR